MRLSVIHHDRGFNPTIDTSGVIVYLDNKRISCLTADEELGEVLCHKRDKNNRFVYVHRKGGSARLMREIKLGEVRIVFPEKGGNNERNSG